MKTTKIISAILLMSISVLSFSQIKVETNGNVGIGTVSHPIIKLYVVNSTGVGYGIYGMSNSSSGYNIGTAGIAQVSAYSKNFGLYGNANSSSITDGRTYGVIGFAGNNTNGYNYGTYGSLLGTKNGAAVFGTVTGEDISLSKRYSGYFVGDVYMQGRVDIIGTGYIGTTITNAVAITSDIRLKTNIKKKTTTLAELTKLQAYSYNYTKSRLSSNDYVSSDTSKTKSVKVIDTAFLNQTRIGFIAQDLQKIPMFDDLVQTADDGTLAIDYIGMIPLIVEALKELTTKTDDIAALKTEIATLKTQINNCCNSSKQKSATSESSQPASTLTNILYPNTPNPFTDKTEIKYTIVDDVVKAMLNVYDLQGFQIKSYPIVSKGSGSVTINGSELKPGIYMYSLIVNGHEIDTKRMILTQ